MRVRSWLVVSVAACLGVGCITGAGGGAGASVPRPAGVMGQVSVLSWAGSKAAVSWTFDDSQPSHIAHYAELQAAGVPMTFYISTGNSSQAGFDATWKQAVRDGHEIGNHSVHHCHADLTGCSFGAAATSLGGDLDECSAYIPLHTGQSDVWTGASPYGDTGYDSDAQSRFFIYRGVPAGMIAPNDDTDPFNLPVHLAASGETAQSLDTLTDAARSSGKWLIFVIHTIKPTTANWYNPVDIADVTSAMSHGKAAGDIWMDTVANIGAYWRGQKIFSSTAPTTSGNTRVWTWTLPAHFPRGKVLRVTVTGGTLQQGGKNLVYSDHGYYEVGLDRGELTLSP